jgi:hypothetical protein
MSGGSVGAGEPPLQHGGIFLWPVSARCASRLLVTQDETGQVWAVYTDFKWIAERHGIRERDAEFATATRVIGSITGAVSAQ